MNEQRLKELRQMTEMPLALDNESSPMGVRTKLALAVPELLDEIQRLNDLVENISYEYDYLVSEGDNR